MVARSFVKFDVALRARLLGRLLASVGPLALKVVGGGVFAKYVRHARSPEIPVSHEDAARATSTQVRDLVHYVEQSNLNVVEELSTALALNDGTCLCRWHMTCCRNRIRSFLLLEAGPSPGRPPPSARGFVFGRDDLRLSLTFLLLAPCLHRILSTAFLAIAYPSRGLMRDLGTKRSDALGCARSTDNLVRRLRTGRRLGPRYVDQNLVGLEIPPLIRTYSTRFSRDDFLITAFSGSRRAGSRHRPEYNLPHLTLGPSTNA
jgi:hypothetical protein